MSNALAIAAVTATLRNLLLGRLQVDTPDIEVTTKPPDTARTGLDDRNQVNLFLYQTAIDPALRNIHMPGRVNPGEIGYPPLALDLQYIITAYAPNDDGIQVHTLLGRVMSTLHDHAVLGADEIRLALPGNDLYRQPERVRLTLQPLSFDELSKVWSAFQQCRLLVAYEASVVLIESTRPAVTPLPVLTRGPADTGPSVQPDIVPPFPLIDAITPPRRQPSVRLGEALAVSGINLAGAPVSARIMHPLWQTPAILPVGADSTSTRVTVTIPDEPATWPAGVYSLALSVTLPGGTTRMTSELPFSLAPRIDSIAPNPATIGEDGAVQLTLAVSPQVWAEQTVSLLLGDREVPAQPHGHTGTVSFVVTAAQPGQLYVRVRVDGVDSLLVDRTVSPPVFDPTQRVTLQ